MERHYRPLILSLCLIFATCAETELMTYGEENFIFFSETANGDDLYPGASFTFIFEDPTVTQFIWEIPVTVTGRFAGADRPFSVIAVDSLTTAVEGTHYEILSEQNAVPDMEAGSNAGVLLKRTADLAETEVTLVLALVADENFSVATNVIYQLTFSDFFAEPEWWPYPEACDCWPNIGPFTQVKAGYWLEFYGIEDGSDPWCCSPYWDGISWNNNFDPPYRLVDFDVCAGDVQHFKAWLEALEGTLPEGECLEDENGDCIMDTLEY